MDTKHSLLLRALFIIQLLFSYERQLVSTEATATTSKPEGVNVTIMGAKVDHDGYIAIDLLLDPKDKILCATNLDDCCNAETTTTGPVGNWYYPDGGIVLHNNSISEAVPSFVRSRGERVLRLFIVNIDTDMSLPPQRGRFSCVVPNSSNVNQTYFVNILDIGEVILNQSGFNTARITGEINFTLECSAYIRTLPGNVSLPTFEWFFGPDNSSLPTDLTVSNVTISNSTYTSTLMFSALSESHSGLYTCRLGGNERLAANTNITVKAITVSITESGTPLLKQNGYNLTCNVNGIEYLVSDSSHSIFIEYQWTKFNGTLTTDNQVLFFSPLELSDAGIYTCKVSVSSIFFSGPATAKNSHNLYIQIPMSNVTMTSDPPSPIIEGASVSLTCTVKMGALVESDLQLFNLELTLSNQDEVTLKTITNGTTLNYSHQIVSFNRTDSGNYSCNATARPHPSSVFVEASDTLSDVLRVTTGVYLKSKCKIYNNNNSMIPISDIGEGDDALLCFTDLRECCKKDHTVGSMPSGNWFYPNESEVGTLQSYPDRGFYKNRDRSVVRLHQRENTTGPHGQFCCEVLDATYKVVTLCINVIMSDSGESDNISSLTMASGNEYCEQTSTSTASQQPVTRIPLTTEGSSDNDQKIASVTIKRSSNNEEETENDSSISGIAAGAAAVLILIVFSIIIVIIIAMIILQRRNKTTMLYEEPTLQSPAIYSVVQKRVTIDKSKDNTGHFVKIIKVGIETTAPMINMFPPDTTVTEGEGVCFKIKVSGEPQPTVIWYHDGGPVKADFSWEIEADGSLAIPSAELKHSGVYKAVATNQHSSEEREVTLAVTKEGEYSVSDELESIVSTRPIHVLEFGKYITELHADSNQPFVELYKSLDSGDKDHTISYATDPQRKALNRFKNIVVYDNNRIVLKSIPEAADCQGDYINACYIDGYLVPDKFIATQGPLPTTLVDFWRLIWQEHPPIIVMVTNVMEGNRIKCQQYWPESGRQQFGPFHVTITDKEIFADYTIRSFLISLDSSGHSHTVTQYHFTAWPDHGVPDYATSVLAFRRKVKAQHHPSKGPILVHCSAGIGRTGTFIAIDNILEQLEKEKIVDVPGVITKMRQRRMKMVQAPEQFIFIHDAILESVTCGDTQISAINLRLAVTKMKKNNGFQYQMKILEQVSPNPNEIQPRCTTALAYPERNRDNNFLPANRWRVILKGEQPDYIHAVNINGYKQKKAFIIAQGPMELTVRNFWKMICDHKSTVVVMLSDLKEGGQEASAQYWPSSGSYQYEEYTVELLGEEPLEGFIIRDLSVMDIKTQKARHVTQLHVTNWKSNGHCSNLKSVIDVIEEMTKVQIRSGNKPIVVHCSDTVTRSGMFCAIATTIERCKTEGVVDVFQVVKALRMQKPGAVPTVDNFKLIFDAVLVFLESFDTYANFQNI